MERFTIIVVEDNAQNILDLKKFLSGQQELPCTVHAINPLCDDDGKLHFDVDPDEVIRKVLAIADADTVILLDNELGRYQYGEYIAERLPGRKIISISSTPNRFAQLQFRSKGLVRENELAQQTLLKMIREVR